MRIELEGLHNVRDLGGAPVADGKTVKRGMLYRGDQLYFATERDKETLAALGIGAVVDFRSPAESAEKPDPEVPGVRNVALPIIRDVRAGITRDAESDRSVMEVLQHGGAELERFVDEYMFGMYRLFVNDDYSLDQYARFFDELVAAGQHGEAVLWHCTAGKDRAGFASAMLLYALGASWDDIIADYMLTNEYLSGVVEQLLATVGKNLPTDEARSAARRFFMADARYLEAARAEAETRYGSFDMFLQEGIGVDVEARERMRILFAE